MIECESKTRRLLKNNEKKNLTKLFQAFNKLNDTNVKKVKEGTFIKYTLCIPTNDLIEKLNDVTDNDINTTYDKILALPALILKDGQRLSKVTAPDQGENKTGSLSAHKILVDVDAGVAIFNADINSMFYYQNHIQTGFVPDLQYSVWQDHTSASLVSNQWSSVGSTVVTHSAM